MKSHRFDKDFNHLATQNNPSVGGFMTPQRCYCSKGHARRDRVRGDSIPGEVLQMRSKRNPLSDIIFETPPFTNPTESRAQVRVSHGFQVQLIVKSCLPCVERKTAVIVCSHFYCFCTCMGDHRKSRHEIQPLGNRCGSHCWQGT